jgi:hypothetical protein
MGWNKCFSIDSREFFAATAKAIKTKTSCIVIPFSRFKIPERIKSPTRKGRDFRTVVETLKMIEKISMASCQESDTSGPENTMKLPNPRVGIVLAKMRLNS